MDLEQAVDIVSGKAEAEIMAKLRSESATRAETRRDRRNMLAEMATPHDGELQTVASWPRHDRRTLSVADVIVSEAEYEARRSGSPLCSPPENSVLRESAQAFSKETGIVPEHGGITLPMRWASGLDTKTGSGGGFTVGTQLLDLEGYLRQKSFTRRLGLEQWTVRPGIGIPTQTSGTTAAWVPENPGTDAPQVDAGFGFINPSPKTVVAVTGFSRKLLGQSSRDTEAFVRGELAAAIANALDQGALTGSGTSGQPVGLLNTVGTNVYSLGTNGAAPSGLALATLEQLIADQNADLGPAGWVTTPAMRNKLRATPAFVGSTLPVWTSDANGDYVLGQRAVVSRLVPQTLSKGSSSDCHAIVTGFWPSMVIVTWGVIELVVDPFALKRRNMIEVTAYLACDIVVRRPQAFGLILDARNM